MKTEIIYCLPGLGLNEKVFSKLKIPSAQLKFIKYVEAEKEETLQSYAAKINEQIVDEEFSLLGMSLGGILSIEISRIRKVKKLYLISTIKNKLERPSFLKVLDKIPNSSTTAAKWAISASVKLKPYYDNSDEEGLNLFKEMMEECSLGFISWGWRVVSNWEFNQSFSTPFYHLHGTADLVFPIKHIDQAETLKGGTHYMIYNNADEISTRIENSLQV